MNNRTRAILVAILAGHVALTVWLSAVLSMWVDEAYTMHTTSLGIGETAHQALVWEVQPPLYFVLANLWRHLGDGIFFVRLLSVIAVALGVYVSGLVASAYLSERPRLWVMAVVAFNPFVIASAIEARAYGLVFLWSALLMWLFQVGYLAERRTASARITFAIVAAAALYTQYYTGFLLPALGAVLILKRRWRDLAIFAGSMMLVGIVFVPVALYVNSEIATNATNFANPDNFVRNLVSVVARLVLDTVPLEWMGRTARHLVLAGIAILVVIVAWQSDRSTLARTLSAPATILVVGALLFVATVTVTHMPISSHYVSAFHLPTFLLLFGLILGLTEPINQRATAVAATAIVLLNVAMLIHDYRSLAKLGDFTRVSSFVTSHESPHQRIVVFDAQSALPLAYYYKGQNPIVPLPHPMRFDRYDLHNVALHNESEVVRGFGYAPAHRAELWLITSDGCRRIPVDFHCELLENFVDQKYRILLDRRFYGSRVRLLIEKEL